MNILSYLRSGASCIYVRTVEQERATMYILNQLETDTELRTFPRFQWRITTGLTQMNKVGEPVLDGQTQIRPLPQIFGDLMNPQHSESIYCFYNIHHVLNQPPVLQSLRDAAYQIRTVGSFILLIGPDMEIPAEIDELVTVLDFDLPDREAIRVICKSLYDKNRKALGGVELGQEDFDTAADALVGLPGLKAEAGFSRCISDLGRVDAGVLQSEKDQAIKRQGVLEAVTVSEDMNTLASFDRVKKFVWERKGFASKAAKDYHLDPPKGILIIGLPGTGKSLAAKAIAAEMGLRLYSLNLGNVFKGIVGSSESTVRQALKTADMAAPCVLLIDEIEKSFSGIQSSGQTDSGVTARVIGTVMTWMQERKSNVFLVGTANTVRGLDPAFIRAGRWDKAFGVDLPVGEEREEIFKIHLEKRGRDPEDFDLDELVEESENFVGAEIEVCIIGAMYSAFSDNEREFTTEDIIEKIRETKPLAVTSADLIQEFRDEWLKTRLENVSSYRVSPISPVRTAGAEPKARKIRMRAGRSAH